MITLVCGPPCSGKTTYVQDHAEPGDTVIDLDDIARELGSPREWQHPPDISTAANALALERIAALEPGDTAWVIRCLPSWAERNALAARLGAHVVVLDPGKDTCLQRAAQRPSGTRKAIALWYWRAAKG